MSNDKLRTVRLRFPYLCDVISCGIYCLPTEGRETDVTVTPSRTEQHALEANLKRTKRIFE